MEPAADFLALTPAKVVAAIERIVADCEPEAVLAFGSRARGQARADSDLDLLVLLPVPVPDLSLVRRRLYTLLADLPFSKDVLVSDPEHFTFWRVQLNSVCHDASQEGSLLWQNGRLEDFATARVCC